MVENGEWKMENYIESILRSNAYPGRGIMIGCCKDNIRSVAVYFIMGRSENSRNRIFNKTADGIQTAAHIPELLTDPSLVIYNPVRTVDGSIIITNGAQTDTISEFMQKGDSFSNALNEWSFEPDPPIYTPRISGIICPDGSYLLSILRTKNGDPAECERRIFEYEKPLPGIGHFISTYQNDGNPPPSFAGEPIQVNIPYYDDLEGFAYNIWNSLNDDNKVSLYAVEYNLAASEIDSIVINKHRNEK